MLRLPAGQKIDFKAGQYLEIILPSGLKCPFSIANSPTITDRVEVHVRPTPDSEDSNEIEALLDQTSVVEIEAPKGDCYLEEPPEVPLFLLAASTGVTQMKSILEYLFEHGLAYPTYLYWGVLDANDLYLENLFQSWSKTHSSFHYIPVVSEPDNSPAWEGRRGLVGEVALQDIDDLENVKVYLSGGAGMVYATLDLFVDHGMPESNLHSDIFSYAPRK